MLRSVFDEPMSTVPCPRCVECLIDGVFRSIECVMPLPIFASLARDGSGKCCRDCGAADLLAWLNSILSFTMSHLTAAETIHEQLRIFDAALGLVRDGIVRCATPGDFDKHREWLCAQSPNHPDLE